MPTCGVAYEEPPLPVRGDTRKGGRVDSPAGADCAGLQLGPHGVGALSVLASTRESSNLDILT